MPSSRQCLQCGAELPDDAPKGLCPKCLMAAVLQPEAPPPPGSGTTEPPLEPGSHAEPRETIGRYKLLQKIGEGGCGIVYKAEQREPVTRLVAVKVIKLGMDTKQVVARFEAERQTLALMDHPNIATVLDGGATDRGRPFFVMELVKGIPITDYCDKKRLDTKARLDLFILVCQGVQHAHQKAIIHRDIKPSNILVAEHDGLPVPKVIDFGIAKVTAGQTLTDKTLFTAFEQFIGTPAYMSPEQARLSGQDIDTRSDIYSLGVLLYELLTGKTPFEAKRLVKAGFEEICRIIREEDPPRPSTRLSTLNAVEQTTVAKQRQSDPPKLAGLVRGDLDWIIMKCLEKERSRRYETVNGLAMELKRFLGNEPVLARSPSNLYRFQKAVRRHKAVFTTVFAVAASLVFGLGLSTWLFIQERAAREKVRIEAAKSRQVSRFLQKTLASAGPSVALGRDATMLREILDKSAAQVGEELKNEPEVQAELYLVMGKTYEELGLYTNAVSLTEEALRLRQAQSIKETPELADAIANLGAMLYSSYNYAAAEKMWRKGLEMRIRLYGNEHTNVATSLSNVGLALWNENKLTEAETMELEALRIRRKFLGPTNTDVAKTLVNLGGVHYLSGSFSDSEENFDQALDIFRQQLPPQHPALALVQNNLATLLSKKGEFAAAVDLHSAVLESRKKTLKEHPYVAYSMTQLAIALTALGELDRAQPLLEEALAMENKIEASQSSDVADTLTALGVVRAEKGDWAGAETNQQTALEIRLKLLGENNPDVSDSLDAVSLLSAVRGDLADSTKSLRRALAITVKAQQANQLNALPVLDHLAWVVAQQGDQAQATEFRAKANVLRDSNGAYTETAWSEGWYLLAHLLCARKEFDKAEPVFTHTAQYFQGHLASSATLRKRSLSQMVQFYEAWNQMSSSPGLEVKIAEWKTKLAELQK